VARPVRGGADRGQALKRLANGKRRKASQALGILAHLLGDIANPMHTDQMWKEESIHSAYESKVDSRSRRTSNVFRFRFDGRDDPSPYRKAIKVARRAHMKYDALVTSFYRSGYSKRVDLITKTQLNRAANALADVAAGIRAKARSLKKSGGGGGGGGAKCASAYPTVCIPPPPPDKDCGDIAYTNFKVEPSDPHGFDSDRDGLGCES
jgi:hypothetical protein